MLWSPLVQSTLRAALYKVIATTRHVHQHQRYRPYPPPAIALRRSWG